MNKNSIAFPVQRLPCRAPEYGVRFSGPTHATLRGSRFPSPRRMAEFAPALLADWGLSQYAATPSPDCRGAQNRSPPPSLRRAAEETLLSCAEWSTTREHAQWQSYCHPFGLVNDRGCFFIPRRSGMRGWRHMKMREVRSGELGLGHIPDWDIPEFFELTKIFW